MRISRDSVNEPNKVILCRWPIPIRGAGRVLGGVWQHSMEGGPPGQVVPQRSGEGDTGP